MRVSRSPRRDLAGLLGARLEIGDRGGHDEHVGVADLLADGRRHVVGALDAHHVVRHVVGGLRGDQHHAGAAQVGLVGDRPAHLAAGAVADEAHRVDALAGAARR